MSSRRWYLSTGTALVMAAGFSMPVMAQGTYDPWRNPDTSTPRSVSSDRKYNQYDSNVKSLVRDLEELIRIGRRDRAADPQFLDDLEDRLESYKGPPSGTRTQSKPDTPAARSGTGGAVVFADSFKSGSQSNSPDWQVVQTGWFIDNSEGLRSNVLAGRVAPQSGGSDNLIDDLFSSKKKRRKKKRKREEARKRAQQPLDAGIAELRLDEPIPNNFNLDLTFKDLGGAGTLSAFLFQSGNRDIGYKLVMRDGGGSTVISLLRVGSATTLIDKRSVPSRRAGGQIPAHEIRWFRYKNRRIGVIVDGKELFTITERSFRDNWDGIALTNTNGHFAIQSIEVSEVR